MRRPAVLLAAAAWSLAAAAPAVGAPPWGETAWRDAPADGVATCLRDAGPGRVATLGSLGRTTIATDVLAVAPDGLAPDGRVELPWPAGCAAAAGAPGAAPVLAAGVHRRAGRRWRGGVRASEPGGVPQALRPLRSRLQASEAAVAVARGGAAVVAWVEDVAPRSSDDRRRPNRLVAATRPAGGRRFGPARTVDVGTDDWGLPPAVAIDPRGRAHVAWIGMGEPERGGEPGEREDAVIRVASAAPGGRFGPPQDLARTWGTGVALAAAEDGRALLVALTRGSTGAWERRPGGRRFEPIPLPDVAAEEPALALGRGGAAVLAYRNSGGVTVLRRAAAGRRFGGVQDVFPDDEGATGSGWMFFGEASARPLAPEDDEGGQLAVRMGAGGEIVVSWVDAADEAGTTEAASAHAVRGTLAGGFPDAAARLGSPCRTASGARAVELRDGRLGVAWTDNARVRQVADTEWVRGGGRVHLALADAPAPAAPPAAPGATAEILDGSVGVGGPLRVRVRCGASACDVRGVLPARPVGALLAGPEPVLSAASTAIPAGGSAVLRLEPVDAYAFVAPSATERVRVALDVCAPGGPVAERLLAERDVRGRPVPPAPRIVGLRATRRPGGAVRVTWRTTRPTPPGSWFIVRDATPTASGSIAGASFYGRGRRRFAVTLEPTGTRIRRVRVDLGGGSIPSAQRAGAPVRPRRG